MILMLNIFEKSTLFFTLLLVVILLRFKPTTLPLDQAANLMINWH